MPMATALREKLRDIVSLPFIGSGLDSTTAGGIHNQKNPPRVVVSASAPKAMGNLLTRFETNVEAGGLITILSRLAGGENHEKDNLGWIGFRVLVLEYSVSW
jgi:hypothetical protein